MGTAKTCIYTYIHICISNIGADAGCTVESDKALDEGKRCHQARHWNLDEGDTRNNLKCVQMYTLVCTYVYVYVCVYEPFIHIQISLRYIVYRLESACV